jgi:hypothetical protein
VRVINAIGAKRIPIDQQKVDAVYNFRINLASKENLVQALEALNRYWKPSQAVRHRLLSLGINDPTLIHLIDVFYNGSAADLELLRAESLRALPQLHALLPLVTVSTWETIITSNCPAQLVQVMEAVRSVQLHDQAAMRLMLKRVAGNRADDNLDLVDAFVQSRFVPSIELATDMAKDALHSFNPNQISKLISLRPDMCDIMLSLVLSTGNLVGLSSLSQLDQRPSQDAIDAAVEKLAHDGRFLFLKSMLHLHLRPSHSAVARIMALPNLSPSISRLFTN